VRTLVAGVVALGFIFPLVVTVTNSLMSGREIGRAYASVQGDAAGYRAFRLVPEMVSLDQYYTVLVLKPQFLFMYWNSVFLVVPIIVGQTVVGSMAAFAFAKLRFRGRDALFFVYIIVMLMPFQVTLVPNYIVADRLGILNTRLAIILPGVFGAFGVFLLRQYMQSIPSIYLASARADGASYSLVFLRVVVPLARPGIAGLAILLLADNWNMVEQPLVLLSSTLKQPLSVLLGQVNSGDRGVAFAAATVYMVPLLLFFLHGEADLVRGIQLTGITG